MPGELHSLITIVVHKKLQSHLSESQNLSLRQLDRVSRNLIIRGGDHLVAIWLPTCQDELPPLKTSDRHSILARVYQREMRLATPLDHDYRRDKIRKLR